MRAVQVLNNNVIIANNDIEDLIILGRGIGFNTRKGDVVNEQLIEKVFLAPTENEEMQNILSIISNIDNKYFNLSHDIIDEINIKTNRKFADSLIIFLAEQLEYKVNQSKNNISRSTTLWSDIRREYPIEFDIVFQTVKIINADNDVRLKKDDVAFLTMFIVHRYTDTDSVLFTRYTNVCKEIKKIIEQYYALDLNSHSYNRFVTHVNMEVKRIMANKQLADNGSADFLDVLIAKYPKEYSVLCEIDELIKKNTDYHLNEMEKMYNMMHLITLSGRKEIL